MKLTLRPSRNTTMKKSSCLYKLCGSDFIFDLCGVLDVLWPLVVLMLKMYLQWSPGWKFPAYVIAVVKQI